MCIPSFHFQGRQHRGICAQTVADCTFRQSFVLFCLVRLAMEFGAKKGSSSNSATATDSANVSKDNTNLPKIKIMVGDQIHHIIDLGLKQQFNLITGETTTLHYASVKENKNYLASYCHFKNYFMGISIPFV